MHPRDEEQKREHREPGEVDQRLHHSESGVAVLFVEAVPFIAGYAQPGHQRDMSSHSEPRKARSLIQFLHV